MLLEGGIVHQDVELSELVDSPRHGSAAEVRVGDVAGNQESTAALRFDRAPCLARVLLFGWEVDDGHVGAFTRVEQRDGAADSRVAAGDERALPLELPRGKVKRRFVTRPRLHLRLDSGVALVLFWIGRCRLPHRAGGGGLLLLPRLAGTLFLLALFLGALLRLP